MNTIRKHLFVALSKTEGGYEHSNGCWCQRENEELFEFEAGKEYKWWHTRVVR